MNFSCVILSAFYQNGLLQQAEKDGLLVNPQGPKIASFRCPVRCTQKALSMLVLFDQLILPDLPGPHARIPALEDKGIVKYETENMRHVTEILTYGEGWNTRSRKQLENVSPIRVQILNFLMTHDSRLVKKIAEVLHMSRRRVYNELLDFAIAQYAGDHELKASSELSEIIYGNTQVLDCFRKDLYGKYSTKDCFGPLSEIIVLASFVGSVFSSLAELATKYNAPIATEGCTHRGAGWRILTENMRLPDKAADTFGILRCALHSEGCFFPKIENIEHALRLRDDPNLKPFRKQLQLFLQQISLGDAQAARIASKEVKKAKRILDKAMRWGVPAEWVCFFALPVGIIEYLLGVIPITGTSLSLLSAFGSAGSAWLRNRNKWVLFGRGR